MAEEVVVADAKRQKHNAVRRKWNRENRERLTDKNKARSKALYINKKDDEAWHAKKREQSLASYHRNKHIHKRKTTREQQQMYEAKRKVCPKRKAYMSEYHRKYFSEQRAVLWELREGKTCAHCDHDQVRHLEFDHLDPTEKIQNVTSISNIKKLRTEAAKCQLLCIWCHRVKTAATHPARCVYTKPAPDAEGRQCHGLLCQGQIRANEHFYLKKGKPGGCCKICKLFRCQQIRNERTAYVRNMKLNVIKQCETCERKVEPGFEMCFDFDHIDQTTKSACISTMMTRSQKMLDAELAKCRLLCCYCHKDHTVEQLEYHYSNAKKTRIKDTHK